MIRKIFAFLALVGLAAAPTFGADAFKSIAPIEGCSVNGKTVTVTAPTYLKPSTIETLASNRSKEGWYAGVTLTWAADTYGATTTKLQLTDNLATPVIAFGPEAACAVTLGVTGNNWTSINSKTLGSGVGNTTSAVSTGFLKYSYYVKTTTWWAYVTPEAAYECKLAGKDYEVEFIALDNSNNEIDRVKMVFPVDTLKLNDGKVDRYPIVATVGETLYGDAMTAVAAIATGGTVEAVADLSFAEDVTIGEGQTLKMNGKKLAFTGGAKLVANLGGSFDFDPAGSFDSAQYRAVKSDATGLWSIKTLHVHSFSYTLLDNTNLVAICSAGECELKDSCVALTLSVPLKDKTYDGNSVRLNTVKLIGKEDFAFETGAAVGDIVITKDGAAFAGDSITDAGAYVFSVTVTGLDKTYELQKTVTVSAIDIAEANVTLSTTEIVTRGEGVELEVSVESVKLGSGYSAKTLKSTDYTVGGTLKASAVDTYTVTVTGIGNYTGTKAATWKIVEPNGAFAADAMTKKAGDPAYGTVDQPSNTLTIDDPTKLVYVNDPEKGERWQAAATIAWPHEAPDVLGVVTAVQYTDAKHALVTIDAQLHDGEEILAGECDGFEATTGEASYRVYPNPLNLLNYETHDYTYFDTMTWTVDITVDKIEQAKKDGATELTFTITAGSYAWGSETEGDVSGIKDTDFTIVLPLEGIKLFDGEGAMIYPVHKHDWKYAFASGVLTATCEGDQDPACPYSPLTMQLLGENEVVYSGGPVELTLENADKFANARIIGATVGKVTYEATSGALTDGRAVNVGSYVAKATVTIGENTYKFEKAFAVTKADISDAIGELDVTSFDFDFGEHGVVPGEIKLGDLTLVKDVDYTIGGVLSGIGSGRSNTTYTVILSGAGANFTGTKELVWTVKCPSREFTADGGKVQQATVDESILATLWNGFTKPTLANNTLTLAKGSDWTYYTAEQAPDGSGVAGWYVGIAITWPGDFNVSDLGALIPPYQFTEPGRAVVISDGTAYFGEDINTLQGFTLKTAKNYLTSSNHVASLTWWKRLSVKDVEDAIAAHKTSFKYTMSAMGLVWWYEGQYQITSYGDKDGIKETDFTIEATGLDDPEFKLYDDKGHQLYPVHHHNWSYEPDAEGTSVVATCSADGYCPFTETGWPMVSIAPTTKSEDYCNTNKALTATLKGAVEFAEATGATVGPIVYSNGTEQVAAPVMPGSYTATAKIVTEGGEEYTISINLTILAGKFVVNGQHTDNAAEALEFATGDAMEILIGKPFMADGTYVVPAKYTYTEYILLVPVQREADCGPKTLDLDGFSVTGAVGQAFLDNQGTLTIRDSSEGQTGSIVGDLTNNGKLYIEGGFFNGTIVNGSGKDEGIDITGGAFTVRPEDGWVHEGYDIVKRDGIYYVEKHIHDYVFLPIGRSLMSATCKNVLVEDPDQLIQFTHCDAREMLIALAVHQEKSFDLFGGLIDLPPIDLPTRKVEYTGEPVAAEVFGINLSAFETLLEIQGLDELKDYISDQFAIDNLIEKVRDILENGWTEENNAEGMAILTQIGEMIGDLGYDTSEFVITREKALEITGLEMSEVTYMNTDTGAALESAPVNAGNYRATATVKTLKGNEITRSWDFSITATSLEKTVVTCEPLTKSFAYDQTEKTIKVTSVTVGGVLIEGYNNAEELIQAFKEGKLTAQDLYDIFKSFSTSTQDFLGKLGKLILRQITIDELRADLEKAFKITTLVEGRDYVITGTTNATDIGTYELAVEGIGNYTGAKKVTWAIKPDCTWKFTQDGATLTATCTKHGATCPLGETVSVGLVPADTGKRAYNRKAIEAVLDNADLFALYTETEIGTVYYTKEGETAKLSVAPSAVGKYTAHVVITKPAILDLSILEQTWTLEIPLEITEGVPTREFGKDAMSFSDLENLEYDAEKDVWNLVIKVDWPERITQILKEPQFTSPENAIIERYVNGESADAPDEVGTLEIETGKFFRLKDVAMEEYVKSVTWTIPLTAGELEAIREGGIEKLPFVLRCGAKVWENDLEGIITKDFMVDVDLNTLELYDNEGKRCYPVHDHVWAFDQVSDTELKATCSGKNNCPAGNELSLALKPKTVTEKAYNGISLGAVLEGADAFRKHTGLTVGEVKYYELGDDGERAEKPLCWAPTAPGKYVAVVVVEDAAAEDDGRTELVLPLTINPLDAECMHVYFKTDCTKFIYNAEEQGPEIHSVWYGLIPLVKGIHYTVEGDSATDVGEYTLKVTGIGKFEGEQTFDWSIVASTRPFGKYAMKVVRGVNDPIYNPLTRTWTCLVTVDWPYDIEQIFTAPQFTDCNHAVVKKDECGGKVELQSGIFYRLKDHALESYVRQVVWTIDLDPDELQKAKDAGRHKVVRTITCSALPWENDPDGLCPTKFEFEIPLDCLKLYDEYGRLCFPVHKHVWSYELSEDKSTLTALCGNKSCPVGMTSLKLNAKDKLYDAEPNVATLAGAREFWIHTDAEIGCIQYFDEKGCLLLRAPVMPGKYVAKVLVKTDGCRAHYTLEKKFEIMYHDFTKADVWMTDDCRVFIFRGTPIRLDVDFVTCGCRWLIEGVDYVVDCKSVTCAKEVGEYEIVVRGIGAYRGEQTIKWKIIWPFREFGKDTLKPVPGVCGKPWAKVEKDGKTVTVANWSNLHYDAKTKTWYAPVTIDWPKAIGPCDLIPQFTDPSVAVIELSTQPGKVFSGTDIALGRTRGEVLTCTIGDVFWQSCCLFVPYLDTVTWAPSFTMDDLVDAYTNGEDHLEFDITVCSPAWAGDPCGLKRTTYKIIIPINPMQIVIGGVPQPLDPSKPLDPGDPSDPESSKSGVKSVVKMYDGQPTNIVVRVDIPVKGSTVKYSTDYEPGIGGAWSAINPTFAHAGTNAVWYVVEALGFVPVTNVQYVVISPRPVTLASGTAEKFWDGEPLTNNVVWAKIGSFVKDEGFVATVTGSQTDIGWSYNTFTWAPAAGTSATNYDVTFEYGTLTVNKRNDKEEDPLPPEKIIETEPGTVKAEVDNTEAGEFTTDKMPDTLPEIAEGTQKESMEDDVTIRLKISTQVVDRVVSGVKEKIVDAARKRGEPEKRIKEFHYRPVDLSLWRDYAWYRNRELIKREVTDIGNDNDVNLNVELPFPYTRRMLDVEVWRMHNDGSEEKIQRLGLGKPLPDGEEEGLCFQIDIKRGRIHICATKFSTYVIKYRLAETPQLTAKMEWQYCQAISSFCGKFTVACTNGNPKLIKNVRYLFEDRGDNAYLVKPGKTAKLDTTITYGSHTFRYVETDEMFWKQLRDSEYDTECVWGVTQDIASTRYSVPSAQRKICMRVLNGRVTLADAGYDVQAERLAEFLGYITWQVEGEGDRVYWLPLGKDFAKLEVDNANLIIETAEDLGMGPMSLEAIRLSSIVGVPVSEDGEAEKPTLTISEFSMNGEFVTGAVKTELRGVKGVPRQNATITIMGSANLSDKFHKVGSAPVGKGGRFSFRKPEGINFIKVNLEY